MIGSTIDRMGLYVLKLFREAGATQQSVCVSSSSEKGGGVDAISAKSIDGEDEAEVVDVTMVSDLSFVSFMREESEAISTWTDSFDVSRLPCRLIKYSFVDTRLKTFVVG